MSTAPQANQWTRERRCVVCGATFSLASHGTDEAKYAAKHLQEGTLDPSVLPPVVSKCGDCLAGRTPVRGPAKPATIIDAKEQQAVAQALAIGQQMSRSNYQEVYYYGKRIGFFVGLLSIGGIALVAGYKMLNPETFQPVPWFLGLTLTAVAGFGTTLWVIQKSRGD